MDEFIRKVGEQFEVMIFTASMSKYANPLLNKLDPDRYIVHRLFRENCTYLGNGFVKDLSQLGRNLKDMIIIDNAPISYSFQPANGLPIQTWINDKTDTQLTDLLPILKLLDKVDDVREYLKRIVKDGKVDYKNALNIYRNEFEITPVVSKINNYTHWQEETPSSNWMNRSQMTPSKYTFTESKAPHQSSLPPEFTPVKNDKTIDDCASTLTEKAKRKISATPDKKSSYSLSNYLKRMEFNKYTETEPKKSTIDRENESPHTPEKVSSIDRSLDVTPEKRIVHEEESCNRSRLINEQSFENQRNYEPYDKKQLRSSFTYNYGRTVDINSDSKYDKNNILNRYYKYDDEISKNQEVETPNARTNIGNNENIKSQITMSNDTLKDLNNHPVIRQSNTINVAELMEERRKDRFIGSVSNSDKFYGEENYRVTISNYRGKLTSELPKHRNNVSNNTPYTPEYRKNSKYRDDMRTELYNNYTYDWNADNSFSTKLKEMTPYKCSDYNKTEEITLTNSASIQQEHFVYSNNLNRSVWEN